MSWKVMLADLSIGNEEREAVRRVLDSKWISMGPETEAFEAEFAEFLGARYAVAVSSGTAALHLSLLAVGIGPGDEVILPSLTFVATANTVLCVGATPVFADITSVKDWTIDPRQIETRITPATKAIMVMHYGGYPCSMDTIRAIADRHNLILLEDAAHAPGARYRDRPLGTWGSAGCFSFFSNKNLTTGEGGMVATNDEYVAKRLRLLRSHGMTTLTWDRHRGHSFSYDVVQPGLNYRIDEIRAALGRVQLAKLEENNRKRRGRAALMRTLLKHEELISLPFADEVLPLSSCHIFPILLERPEIRPAFMEHMKVAGIQTSIHYPPVHLFTAYRNGRFAGSNSLQVTEDVAGREVTLPLFPDMTNEQVEIVAAEACKQIEAKPIPIRFTA